MMNEIEQLLLQRLEAMGIESASVAGLTRDVANCLFIDAAMALSEVNRRLCYLGWEETQLDYHTFQLLVAWIEDQGRSRPGGRNQPLSVATPRLSGALA